MTVSNFVSPPNLMDNIYRNQRFIYDASRKYYLLGRDHLIEQLKPPIGGTVLELGCGTGRNLILAGKRYPTAEFFGIDISQEMLKTAGNSIYKSRLENRVQLARADATNMDSQHIFGIDKFDRIFISFSLSMIPSWENVIIHAQTLLKPGGQIHIIDFGNCENLPNIFKWFLYKWLSIFHVHPIPNLTHQLNDIATTAGNEIEIKHIRAGYSIYACIKSPELNKTVPTGKA